MKKTTLTLMVLFICTLKIYSQNDSLDSKSPNHSEPKKKYVKLSEAELYFLNTFHPEDLTVKFEGTNNAYKTFGKGKNKDKFIKDFYLFHDMNLHLVKDSLHDLVTYAQYSVGFKNIIQGAVEMGSVSGKNYVGLGFNLMIHEKWGFDRAALVARADLTFSNAIFGYEYFTEELKIGKLTINSTGVGRFIFPANQLLFQGSLWLSCEKFRDTFFGGEFEHDKTKGEFPNNLYIGIKKIF